MRKSTISRELGHNRSKRGYRPKQAQKLADARRFVSRERITRQTWLRAEQLLRVDWSPQLISHWLWNNEGLSENTNALTRQYFPKGMDFVELTQEDANRAMDKLNNRPRECRGFKTPNQVFFCP